MTARASLRRVLMVSPHFPPDSNAASHRVRLIAPHLPAHGWEPIVVTVDPASYEGRLDPGLSALVPPSLRVIRARALSPGWTRPLGIGDLGLRALPAMYRACASVIRRESVDAVFVTTYPIYTALVGPMLKRRFSVPFAIDLQDPWVGAWGRQVGGAADGTPDVKSRLTRAVAARLEGPILGSASAIVAVSARTYEDVLDRHPGLRGKRCAAMPIGGDVNDFASVAAGANGAPNAFFDRRDGSIHLCAVGTILPMGMDTLRTLLASVADLRRRRPELANRLRLHFFGTSNTRSGGPAPRVEPLAISEGVADLVTEHPSRIDYLDAIRVQLDAHALLLLGSSEAHYTASKLFPALASRRPLLAVYHEASSVVGILRQYTRPPTVRVISYSDDEPVATREPELSRALEALAESHTYTASDVDDRALRDYSADTLAGQLAGILEEMM
jgi:hypothetical protein